jgi:hypothetical protein
MTNEQFNAKMEFIVEQQAQFAADIQVMRGVHEADVKVLKEQDRKLSAALASATELVNGLAISQARNDARIAENSARIAESNARTDAQIAESNARADAKLAELSDRLNIFIDVVERHISENGTHDSPDHA